MICAKYFGGNSLRIWWVQCVVIGALCISLSVNAEPQTITVSGVKTNNINDNVYFYTRVLELALEKTRATDGDFVIAYLDHKGGIERDRAMLIAGVGINVMWASVTKERAQKLRLIDFDLLKGLNNYRALLIHKSSQASFAKVKTLEDLKAFSAGSGPYWTDGLIMQANGFNVVYGANYGGLFKMLGINRFDFLSRGLHEIGSDLIAFSDLGLVAEPHLMLQYETPLRYSFFVNKDNSQLADRLERGLKAAQQDGSFDRLFMQMPMLRFGSELLQNSPRQVFKIYNNTSL